MKKENIMSSKFKKYIIKLKLDMFRIGKSNYVSEAGWGLNFFFFK